MTLLEFKLNEENDNYYYFTIVIEIGGCVYKKKEIKIIDCFKAKSPGKEWSRRISDGDYLRHSLSFDFEYNIILLNDLTILANELKKETNKLYYGFGDRNYDDELKYLRINSNYLWFIKSALIQTLQDKYNDKYSEDLLRQEMVYFKINNTNKIFIVSSKKYENIVIIANSIKYV